MRSIRFGLLALGAALISATAAQAQTDTRSMDGQSLATQSPDTQALFSSTWGDRAPSEWITEHNALLGSLVPLVAVPATPKPISIIMNDHDQFVPAWLSVPRGTAVSWANHDTDAHTVTGDPAKSFPGVKVVEPAGAKPFDSGLVDANQAYTFTFDTVGHYIYICTVHAGAGMVATIDVV